MHNDPSVQQEEKAPVVCRVSGGCGVATQNKGTAPGSGLKAADWRRLRTDMHSASTGERLKASQAAMEENPEAASSQQNGMAP
jgi:hypothetical protein